jgi:hypothetical protein
MVLIADSYIMIFSFKGHAREIGEVKDVLIVLEEALGGGSKHIKFFFHLIRLSGKIFDITIHEC